MRQSKKKKEDSGRQFVFTSQVIRDIIEKQNIGMRLYRHENPWFKNQRGIRRAGCAFKGTKEEISEYVRCKLDIHYFAEKYCQIKREDGSVGHIQLRDYQRDIISLYNDNRFSMLMASRQTGKTISAAITILHFVTFNNNKGVMIAANKAATVEEILQKIKDIYKHLPFFLKVGVVNWAKRSLAFENECRIKTEARTKEPSIGFTIDLLYLDEFAHIPKNIVEHFYKSTVPTVSSLNDSKIIITSTPNGKNLFYDLFTAAELPKGHPKKNPYKAMRVYWWQVPKRRDTKIYFDDELMKARGVNKDEVMEHIRSLGGTTYTKRELKEDGTVGDVDMVEHTKDVSINTIRAVRIRDVSICEIAGVTNWEESEIKLIGGQEAFNQEYNIEFLSGASRLFSSAKMQEMDTMKVDFEHMSMDVLDDKFPLSYENLTWTTDRSAFDPCNPADGSNLVLATIDLAEGLGQDYSAINFWKLMLKDTDDLRRNPPKTLYDAFRLRQIGLYRCNTIKIEDLATLFYLLAFEYFDHEKFKAVLEYNTYGSEFLARLPYVLNGKNNYGSYVFSMFKHRIEDIKTKIGIKVTPGNKNLMVREYVDRVEKGFIEAVEENTQREMNDFAKAETRTGKITYRSESGNDDIAMTVVHAASFFDTVDYQNFCQMAYDALPTDVQLYITNTLREQGGNDLEGYSIMRSARSTAHMRRR